MAARAAGLYQRRRASNELMPPNMSEVSVVLLGDSWSEKCSVGNLILGKTGFNSREEPTSSIKVQRTIQGKNLTVINSPDLFNSRTPKDKLKEQVEQCLRLCTSIPHLFLLVVQPENFTEDQKKRFYSVLELFSNQSFDCSLVLISASSQKYQRLNQALQDLIRRCQDNSYVFTESERNELLGRIRLTLEKRNEEHQIPYHPGIKYRGESLPGSEATPGPGQSLGIMLFGTTVSVKTQLCNLILERNKFHQAKLAERGLWKGTSVTVVTTPESQKGKVLIEDLKSCISLCPPGPNVLLLVVNPSDFTEKDLQTLKTTLGWFGEDAFKHSIVIVTQEGKETSFALNSLVRECEGRRYNLAENNQPKLMMKIEEIATRGPGAYLTIREDGAASRHDQTLPSLNLVLFGPGKSSAATAILGQTDLGSASSSSECVRKQGEVGGRRVSVVELPALAGKAQQEVMVQSVSCISLCEPEGVHAFILVLPVAPLTDESKAELHAVQNAFGARLKNNIMILFTADSDPKAPPVVHFLEGNLDIQELIKSCGGRHVAVKNSDRKQFSTVIDYAEKMIQNCYTSATLLETYMYKIAQQEKNTRPQSELSAQSGLSGAKDKRHYERLRIVLIGKTGCGKSSSGNTILGRKHFEAKLSKKSVTKSCKKVLCEVDGRPVAVVDTPGLFDDSLSNEDVNKEMLECISLLAPGPHVFLVVVPLTGRLTQEEKDTLQLIKDGFGKTSEEFTIILFTGGDALGKQSIEDFIKNECDESFNDLIDACGKRYHVFDNKNTKSRRQVTELIRKIDALVNKNGCFTNEMLQEAETAIQREIQRILKGKEEQIEREKKELEERYKKEKHDLEEKMRAERAKTKKEIKEKDEKIREIKEKLKLAEAEMKEQREAEEKWKCDRESPEEAVYESIEIYEDVSDYVYKLKEPIGGRNVNTGKETLEDLRYFYETTKVDLTRTIEEDKRRKEEEARNKEEMYVEWNKELEELRERYEEEARQKAEGLNDFKNKYINTFAVEKHEPTKHYHMLLALKELRTKHRSDMVDLVKCVTKKRENLKKIRDLLAKQEEEIKRAKTPPEKTKLYDKHDGDIGALIQQLLSESKDKCHVS